MTQKHVVKYNRTQTRILKAKEKSVFMISGLGAGKSFCLGAWVKHRAQKTYIDHAGQRRSTLGLICAPSDNVIRDSTMPQVMKAWAAMGIRRDEHFVVGRRPPEHWGVAPYSPLWQDKVITFYWGAYIIVGGLDNYNRYRGPEFDYIAVDEFRDIKPEAWDVLIGRLRGDAFKNMGVRHQIFCATTPPEDFEFLEQLTVKPDTAAFFTTSHENKANLPPGYLEDLKSKYDKITYQREVLGKFVNANSMSFAYEYMPEIHDYEENSLDLFTDLPLYLSFDFNVDPMTCVIGQRGQGWANIIDEIDLVGSPHDVCDEIKHRYPGMTYLVTGDREGYSRQKAIRGNPDMFRMIARELDIDYHQDIIAPKANLHLQGSRGSRALVNSVLKNHPKFRIDKVCRGLRADLRRARVTKEGELDKGRGRTEKFLDKLDCFRYLVHTWFPRWLDSGQ